MTILAKTDKVSVILLTKYADIEFIIEIEIKKESNKNEK